MHSLVSVTEFSNELTASIIRAEVCKNRKETFLWLQTYICAILKFKLHKIVISVQDVKNNRADERMRNEAPLMLRMWRVVPR
jgi:hypothetical protein